MPEREQPPIQSDDTVLVETNLDGSPLSPKELSRRRFVGKNIQRAVGLTVAAGAIGGGVEVSNLITAKNESDTRIAVLEREAREAAEKNARRLNNLKQFGYDTTLSQLLDGFETTELKEPLEYLDGVTNRTLIEAMRNGEYESRTHAFVRMKKAAATFTDEHYEAIASFPKGNLGSQPFTGNRNEFIETYSNIVAYAASVGAQIEDGDAREPNKEMRADAQIFTDVDTSLGMLKYGAVPMSISFENGNPIIQRTESPTKYFLDTLSAYSSYAQKYVATGKL